MKEKTESKPVPVPTNSIPDFDADSAYIFTEKQVLFGPRVPNSNSHDLCAKWLEEKLKSYTQYVFVQQGEVKSFDNKTLKIKNIIASFNPENRNRILFCAHWDSRPFADQDEINMDKPIPGANDGASGVAVLLEIARNLNVQLSAIGVDIVLFDAEDYGQPENSPISPKQDTWCLGSQYWSKKLKQPNAIPLAPFYKGDYSPIYGILLDMVGAKYATFGMEGFSNRIAPSVVKKVWYVAEQIGYSNYFVFKETPNITDDHYYINTIAGIPCIDIIQYDETSSSGFYVNWHTHRDNMEGIDRNTLKAVGQTLLKIIFDEGLPN